MSTYLDMWGKIRELNREETLFALKLITPTTGRTISFQGLDVVDIDLSEGLRSWLEDVKV